MSDYKPGSIATASNGRRWKRDSDLLWYPLDGASSELDDGLIFALGLTVTPPPQVPVVIAEGVYKRTEPNCDSIVRLSGDPFEKDGAETLTVLKDAMVIDDVTECYRPLKCSLPMLDCSNPNLVEGKNYRVIVTEEPQS